MALSLTLKSEQALTDELMLAYNILDLAYPPIIGENGQLINPEGRNESIELKNAIKIEEKLKNSLKNPYGFTIENAYLKYSNVFIDSIETKIQLKIYVSKQAFLEDTQYIHIVNITIPTPETINGSIENAIYTAILSLPAFSDAVIVE